MRKNVRVVTCSDQRNLYFERFSKEINIDDINALMDHQYSRNSLLAMRKDWNLFSSFCQVKGVKALPASATAIRLFLEKESKSRKYATIKRYAVTIGLVHRTLGCSDPTASLSVQTLLSDLRVAKKNDASVTNQFTKEHLDALSLKLRSSLKLSDCRDLAIYHLMFECMLKRSELKQLLYADINANSDAVTISIKSHYYSLGSEASAYITKWLTFRGQHEGPLFTAIDRHGYLSTTPLDDSSIYRIMRSASDKLRLDVKFSGQSLRVGAVNEMAKKGIKVQDIQRAGRWVSAAMPYHYIGNKARSEEEKIVFKRFKPWD